MEFNLNSVFYLSVYFSRRTDVTLDRLDNLAQKSKTARAVPRTDGVIRKNKVTAGHDSSIAVLTAKEPQQAVAERTELVPEPELGDFKFYHYLKMLMSMFTQRYIT
jgi:hypothetical protein